MIITLLTDFGTTDHYVGVMKGVILGHDARIQLVDITHEVPPGRVEAGAFSLLAAYRWFPPGTVNVAVVDPGVGTARRALVVEAANRLFVGPDNGLFSYLLEWEPGAIVHEVTEMPGGRPPQSATFHGRDLFAPVGAMLAAGVAPDHFGPELAEPIRLPQVRPRPGADGALVGRILHIDRFGNCVTSIGYDDVPEPRDALRMTVRDREIGIVRRHYSGGSPGETFMIWGSSGFLEISVNGASAAAQLAVGIGTAIEVRPEASSA